MKTIFIFVITLLLVSCGQVSQRQSVSKNSDTLLLCPNSKNKTDILVVLPSASKIDSLAMILRVETVHISVGSELVLNTFENRWYRWSSEEESNSQKWSIGAYEQFVGQYNFDENSSTMIEGKYFRPLFNITPHLATISTLNVNREFRAIAIRVAEYQHFTLYSFLTEDIFLQDREGDRSAQIQSLVSIYNGRIIDNLVVAYTFSDGFGGGESQFFYYDGKYIHIKRFNHPGDWVVFAGYQKFQITPHGRFIRYAEENRKQLKKQKL